MRTPSLRRRAVLWSVGVLALLLLVTGFGVDLALGSVLRSEQRDRLQGLASFATTLTGLTDEDLADRMAGVPGVRSAYISYASGKQQVVGVPQAPPDGPGRPGPRPLPDAGTTNTPVSFTQDGDELTASVQVRNGVELSLTSDNGPIELALSRFRIIMLIASAVAIALAAILLPGVLGRAMRPLTALTDAARQTAAGGRGRRLGPRNPRTDLGRAARQFDAMLEELEGAERRASEAAERLAAFLSDASHELRTPLAGVSAGAERLIRDPLDDDERDQVAVQVVREARRGARLVDDLLLVSRMGELRVEARPTELTTLLSDAAERLRARPGAPAVEVRTVEATVAVDRERTDQVLANLLVNAANAGAHRVRIAAAVADGLVDLRVSDDGPGIPADKREAVFERLVRLDPARAAGRGGAGLGLPIARGLAEAQGGSLTALEPHEGDLPGAVLLLRLPTSVVPAPAAQVRLPA